LIKILTPRGGRSYAKDIDSSGRQESNLIKILTPWRSRLGGDRDIAPWGTLKRFCLTIHHDLLEYVSSQMTFEAIMKAEIKRRWPLDPRAAGDRSFSSCEEEESI
jgi:hypothetical protein